MYLSLAVMIVIKHNEIQLFLRYTQFLKVYETPESMQAFYRNNPYTKKFYPNLFKQ